MFARGGFDFMSGKLQPAKMIPPRVLAMFPTETTAWTSGALFLLAIAAYKRTAWAKNDLEDNQPDALAAILFAAATLEATINEFPDMIRAFAQAGDAEMLTLGRLLDAAERSRAQTVEKYRIALRHFGRGADEGRRPFQDFALLFSIRDTIAHRKPERIVAGKPHKLVLQLRTYKLVRRKPDYPMQSWSSEIQTRAVARWACASAIEMGHLIGASLPDTPTGRMLKSHIDLSRFSGDLAEAAPLDSRSASQLRDAIRQAERRGATQYQMAKVAGMPRSMLSRIASGQTVPRIDTAERLARVLGMRLILVAS
jgi:DNA-binding phage protein